MSVDPIKHRRFYVNGKLEFALFFDPNIKDKKKILDDFLELRDWKSIANYCGWTFVKADFSDDLMEVRITVKEKKEPTSRPSSQKKTDQPSPAQDLEE